MAGILDLGRESFREIVESDVSFLIPLFATVHTAHSVAPKCDVLFLYVVLTEAGAVAGSDQGLREIIRDSGARIVVVASGNPSERYIKAGKPKPYGRANLVMTLDRRGELFGRFFAALFSRMKRGASMPSAWVELCPQQPELQHIDCPGTIFACELGPLAFS